MNVFKKLNDLYDEVTPLYDEIVSLSFEYKVEYDAVCDYIDFLRKYTDDEKILELGKKLESIYDENEEIPLFDKSRLWNTLGLITSGIPNMQTETEEYYKKATEANEELIKIDRNKYLRALAAAYDNSRFFYKELGNNEKYEYYFLKTIPAYEELIDSDDKIDDDIRKLAVIYENAKNFYEEQENREKAEYYFFKAISAYEKYINVISEKYSRNRVYALIYRLAELYYVKAAELYSTRGENEKAEYYYTKAVSAYEAVVDVICEKYSRSDAYKYMDKLSKVCIDTAKFYGNKGESEKAESYYIKAVSGYKEISDGIKSNTKKSSYYSKIISLYKKLVKVNRKYLPDLAQYYSDGMDFYINKKDIKKAKKYYDKAVKAYEELVGVEENCNKYLPDLEQLYNKAKSF